MTKTRFEYFHNHGDEDGNNSLTIYFGDLGEPLDEPGGHTIITCENTEEDAIEVVKRLNAILDTYLKEGLIKFKQWYDKLSPADKCTVWSGFGTGLYNKTDEDLIDDFIRKQKP